MNDTRTRPLPTDIAKLKAWLPVEPTGTEVSRARAAVMRIDRLIADLRAQLADLDACETRLVAELAQAADDTDLDDLLESATSDLRTRVEHQLALVQRARDAAERRVTGAQRSDVHYVAWQRECAQITAEWNELIALPNDADRFAALVELVARLNPSADEEQFSVATNDYGVASVQVFGERHVILPPPDFDDQE